MAEWFARQKKLDDLSTYLRPTQPAPERVANTNAALVAFLKSRRAKVKPTETQED